MTRRVPLQLLALLCASMLGSQLHAQARLQYEQGMPAFTDAAVRDPAIAAFRRRVTVSEDPALSAAVPRLKPARVTVTFTDGRQVTRLRESARGDYQDPYREDELRGKFRELAGVDAWPICLSTQDTDEVVAAVAALVILGEFFGALGLITGTLGRAAAFGILATMTGAILMVHAKVGFFMNWAGTQQGEGYEFHLLALAMAALIVWKGSGAYSVDQVIAERVSK